MLGLWIVLGVVVVVALWAVFRSGPTTIAAGAQFATLPSQLPPQASAQPSSAPPSTSPSPPPAPCSPSGTTVKVQAQGIAFDTH